MLLGNATYNNRAEYSWMAPETLIRADGQAFSSLYQLVVDLPSQQGYCQDTTEQNCQEPQ